MTIAELNRLVESKERRRKFELQQRAFMDYTLADLIGKSVSRVYSNRNKMPELQDAYSYLFDEKDKKIILDARQEHEQELSALNFMKFADSFNKRFKEVKEVQED